MAAAITETDSINGFCAVGVKEGMMLEVHCSMSGVGNIQGGAEAIISSIKAVVDDEGAIIMPSFKLSPNLPLSEKDKKLGLKLKIKKLVNDNEKSAIR